MSDDIVRPTSHVQLIEREDNITELYFYGQFQCSWDSDREWKYNAQAIAEYAMSYGAQQKCKEIAQVLGIRR